MHCLSKNTRQNASWRHPCSIMHTLFTTCLSFARRFCLYPSWFVYKPKLSVLFECQTAASHNQPHQIRTCDPKARDVDCTIPINWTVRQEANYRHSDEDFELKTLKNIGTSFQWHAVETSGKRQNFNRIVSSLCKHQ